MKMVRLIPLNFGMHHCPIEKMKMQNLNMKLKRQTYWTPEHKARVIRGRFL